MKITQKEDLSWFSRQRDALAYYGERFRDSNDLRVFSVESEQSSGARKFVVGRVDAFWIWYLEQGTRHCYELIPDGHKCRLFFDLEYSKDSNPSVDEQKMIDHFVENVVSLVFDLFSITITSKDFLFLDSSTSAKFSSHCTIHFPDDKLFPSAVAMKSFMEKLKSKLLESPPFRLLNNNGTKETVLCDLAVYTSNRNFRLFMSSKSGKETSLVRADYCTFYDEQPSRWQIFVDSLVVPVEWQNRECVVVEENPVSNNIGETTRLERTDGSGCSPWPALDEYMLSVIGKWKRGDTFRKWSINRDMDGRPVGIMYYPSQCRFCYNIGRQHKSNGTYWTVNLRRLEYFQKCFDFECRGFRSNVFPLPTLVKDHLNKKLSEEPVQDENDCSIVDPEKVIEDIVSQNNYDFFEGWESVFGC